MSSSRCSRPSIIMQNTDQPMFVKTIFDEDASHLDAAMIIDLITLFDSGDPYYGKVGVIARNRTKALLEIERNNLMKRQKLDSDVQAEMARAEEKLNGFLAELQRRLHVNSRNELPPYGAALADEIELVYMHKVEVIQSKVHLLRSGLAVMSKESIVGVHEVAVERLEALLEGSSRQNKARARIEDALLDASMALAEAKEDLRFQSEICVSLTSKKKKQMQVHQRPSRVGTLFEV